MRYRSVSLAALGAFLCAFLAAAAMAQGRTFVLVADGALEESGLLKHIVPRFALKHGMRPTVEVRGEGDLAGADAVLLDARAAAALNAAGLAARPRGVFRVEGGESYAVALVPGGANGENAAKFADWLVSEIGARTVESFAGPVAYLAGGQVEEVVAEAGFDGDAREGEELSHRHCGRCHVVSERNRFGGIGSTPSFRALRSIPSWKEKFEVFWIENPHPVFMQVEGMTLPFDPNRPPHIVPVELDLDEVEAILAYVASIEPLDLGAPIVAR